MKRIPFLIAIIGSLLFCLYSLFSGAYQNKAVSPSWRAESAPPSAESCRTCHEKYVDRFHGAPHSRTLLSGTDPLVLSRFGDKSFANEQEKAEFQVHEGRLYYHHSRYPEPVQVDWVFGSGSHAMTPVSLISNAQGKDQLVQLRTSWYPNNELGPTLGQNTNADSLSGVERIGKLSDHAETMNCFGCHITNIVPTESRLTEDTVQPGVSCDRCHPGSVKHLQAQECGNESHGQWGLDWSKMTAMESVNRCGGCHRRADEMNPEDLTIQETDLPRLASVGLTLSPCFHPEAQPGSAEYLTCTTCHDPHAPASKIALNYVRTCRKCHSENSSVSVTCSNKPDSNDCLDCHMPKVEVAPHLKFTDHWIRVRND
ncbi:MAG TPA: hypothetical protein DD473_03380 [Planctomycetaceae bacterium]|nr:hypothetical protein [Planctomycetaceae bacterium]